MTGEYVALFFSTFLSATLIPIGSAPVVALMIQQGYNVQTCLIVATLGNTLGGMTNYVIGLMGKLEWAEKYLKIKREKIYKFQYKVQKYGHLISLFTWLPVIGDPLSLALGYFRIPWFLVFVFMLIGKYLRYLVWALVTLEVIKSGIF